MPSIEKIRVGETEYDIADSKNIAPVEMSSTSANAYAVGDMLIYNGQLYDVISAIAVGNTLTVGTNIQASKVSAKIKQISTDLSGLNTDLNGLIKTTSELSKTSSTSGEIVISQADIDNAPLGHIIRIYLTSGSGTRVFIPSRQNTVFLADNNLNILGNTSCTLRVQYWSID